MEVALRREANGAAQGGTGGRARRVVGGWRTGVCVERARGGECDGEERHRPNDSERAHSPQRSVDWWRRVVVADEATPALKDAVAAAEVAGHVVGQVDEGARDVVVGARAVGDRRAGGGEEEEEPAAERERDEPPAPHRRGRAGR
eukprot:5126648-Prymnesium_polylepis.1